MFSCVGKPISYGTAVKKIHRCAGCQKGKSVKEQKLKPPHTPKAKGAVGTCRHVINPRPLQPSHTESHRRGRHSSLRRRRRERRTARCRRRCPNSRRATHGRSTARQAREDRSRPNTGCPLDTSALHTNPNTTQTHSPPCRKAHTRSLQNTPPDSCRDFLRCQSWCCNQYTAPNRRHTRQNWED
jgi:hypothetical protein